MATIDNKKTVLGLLENDGYYPGDPQLATIYSYIHTMTEVKVYGIYLNSADIGPYGPFCRDITLLWDRKEGLTTAGEAEVEEIKAEKGE